MQGKITEAKRLSGKEYTQAQSKISAKELIKTKKRLNKKDFKAGKTLFLAYNAKFKEFTYDKTPLVLVLRNSAKYTLGLNIHWLPFMMRQALVVKIMQMNKYQIENDKPLMFSYEQLKPFLKQFGYAPCIRLYINTRFSKQGVVIPSVKLPALSKMRGETFMQGKHTSTDIFKQVTKNANKAKKKNGGDSRKIKAAAKRARKARNAPKNKSKK